MSPLPPQDPSKDSKDDFSLDHRHPPAQPLARARPNSWITFFRFMIWISPGPACLMLIAMTFQFYRMPFLIGLILAAVISLFIGACDAFLDPSVPKENGTPLIQPTIEHSIKFAMLQILVAPATIIILGFGACAIASIAYA